MLDEQEFDIENIAAIIENGLLIVDIPRHKIKQKVSPKTIEVT